MTELLKNRDFWKLQADSHVLDTFLLEKILPKTGRQYPLPELALMSLAVAHARPTHIFEWGTNIGASALAFHVITGALDLEIPIHSWDLPEDAPHGQHPGQGYAAMVKGMDRIFLHREDGLTGALRLARGLVAENRPFQPLFFVDGDHAYQSVRRELSALIPLMENFHILAHDTFVQKPDGKGLSRESWLACPTTLEEMAEEYRWVNVGFGFPGMAYLWGRASSRPASFRGKVAVFLDRAEILAEKKIFRLFRRARRVLVG